jgi:hypothetical protein
MLLGRPELCLYGGCRGSTSTIEFHNAHSEGPRTVCLDASRGRCLSWVLDCAERELWWKLQKMRIITLDGTTKSEYMYIGERRVVWLEIPLSVLYAPIPQRHRS